MISLEKVQSVKELFPIYFLQAKVEIEGRARRKILLFLYSAYPCMVFLTMTSPSRNSNENIQNTPRLFMLLKSKS